ncbi:M56 family metallopeptidase [Solimicrobium silvestre]|uniref:BlaR1 peptidase M56 n=1 Tax=Solimicrobium silvestre TaxID=2099400 RepID=A0A2S9H3M9_9BURK|nr:M56 family metallopeptidase [Solimicrobium silvestre]PRC94594.1 BlaR1 peptidase M56 [Solimicrobium silvestre]
MNAQFGFVSAVAHALLHSLWQVALLALLAEVSFSQLRHRSAMARHAVGMGWLVMMLLVPLLTFTQFWQSPSLATDGVPIMPIPFTPGVEHFTPASQPWLDWVLVATTELWLLGAALMLVLQLGGWRMIKHMEQQPYVDLPPEWRNRIERLRGALGISRAVAIRMASKISSPCTAHVLRPIIWLPLTLLTHLPPDQIEALLAHELAHIRRLDWCWNALQCVIESVLFFHPAMWWLSRRIREEREHACDDLAVAVCGNPIALAEALAGLQRQRLVTPRFALAAQGGSLMKRISHLLSGPPARQNWRIPVVLLLLLCSGTLLAMQVEPPRHLLLNLRIDASSNGALTPGNFREYTADYVFDKQRYYRISMDQQGQVREVYKEDGRVKPVDNAVHMWAKELQSMATPPEPPELPALAEVGAPPIPPTPPVPPEFQYSDELKDLFKSMQADGRLAAMVGAPISVERGSFHGSFHTWGARDFHLWGIDDPVGGKAGFSINFVGPKGRAKVAYAGKTQAGVWQASKLEISPLVAN